MDDEILLPRSDLVFKLIFGDTRNIDILVSFLQAVLDLPADEYGEISIIDPNLRQESEDDKLGILDKQFNKPLTRVCSQKRLGNCPALLLFGL
jgi:hypothetical protein